MMKTRFGGGGGGKAKAKRSVVGALRAGLGGGKSSAAGSGAGSAAGKAKQAKHDNDHDHDDDAYAAAYAAAYGNDDDGYSYGGTGSYEGGGGGGGITTDNGSLFSGDDDHDDEYDDHDDEYANAFEDVYAAANGEEEQQQKQQKQRRPPPFQSRASSISLDRSDRHEARVDDVIEQQPRPQAQPRVASLFPDISLGGTDTDEQMDGSFVDDDDDDETYEEDDETYEEDDEDDDDEATYEEEDDEEEDQQPNPIDDDDGGGVLFPDILAEMDDDLGMLGGDDGASDGGDESLVSATAEEEGAESEAQIDVEVTIEEVDDADIDGKKRDGKDNVMDVDRTATTEVETPAASPEKASRGGAGAAATTDSVAYPSAEEVAVAVQRRQLQEVEVDQIPSVDADGQKEEEEEEESAASAAQIFPELADRLEKHKNELEETIHGIEGQESAAAAAAQIFPEQVDDASEEELDDEIEKAIHDIESDGDDESASASAASVAAPSTGGDDEEHEEHEEEENLDSPRDVEDTMDDDDNVVVEPTAVNTGDDSSSLRAAEASLVDDLSSHGDAEANGDVEQPEENETEEKKEEDVEESRPTIDPTAIDSSDESSEDGEDTASSLNNSSSFAMVADDRSLGADNGPNSVDSNKANNVGDNDDNDIDEGAYLPSTYSSTPPTPRKKDVAFAEGTTPKKKEKSTIAGATDDDDRTMASETSRRTTQTAQTSNTDATAQISNLVLALVEPIDNRECGIGRGDIILSILSMPKTKSSRSAAAAPATDDTKVETNNAQSPDDKAKSEMAMWAGKNVKDAIWRMRKLHARIEKEVTANLPVPGSIEAISEDADLDRVSRPADASKYGKLLQNRAAEALRRNDLGKALEGYEEIYASYKIALERQRRKQGRHGNMTPEMDRDLKYHPSLGAALYNVGIVLLLSSRYDEALEKFEESRRVRAKKLGKQSAEYIASLSKKATALYALGRLSEAQAVFEEVLTVAPKNTPSDKAELAEIQNSYGCTLYAAGQRDVALRNFEQSLFINKTLLDESIYGDADATGELIMARTAATLNNIGQIGLKNREYEKAKAAFEGSYKYQFLLFNPSNPFVLATMDKLAFTNVKKGDRGKALSMYNQMLEAQIEVLGPHHIDCAQTLTKISLVHVEEKNFRAAESAAQMVVEAEARNENNPKVSGRFKSLSKAAKKGFAKKKKNAVADKN